MSLEEYSALKRQLERLRREADREAGAHQQRLEQLQKEFGCSTLEEAEELITTLESKRDKLQAKRDKAYATFLEEYGDKL